MHNVNCYCEHCFYGQLCSSRSDFTFSQLYCCLLLHTLFLFPGCQLALAQCRCQLPNKPAYLVLLVMDRMGTEWPTWYLFTTVCSIRLCHLNDHVWFYATIQECWFSIWFTLSFCFRFDLTRSLLTCIYWYGSTDSLAILQFCDYFVEYLVQSY